MYCRRSVSQEEGKPRSYQTSVFHEGQGVVHSGPVAHVVPASPFRSVLIALEHKSSCG